MIDTIRRASLPGAGARQRSGLAEMPEAHRNCAGAGQSPAPTQSGARLAWSAGPGVKKAGCRAEPDHRLLLLTLHGRARGRSQVNDRQGNAGAAAVPAGHRGAGEDAEVLHRIGLGDQDAMAEFYRDHGRVVLSQVLLVTGERVLAEEIVQDTMLAVWRGAGSFRGESSARSWVLGIARRQTRDQQRGRRLRLVDDSYLADQPVRGPGPETTALDRAELAEVMTAIRQLAAPHREVLGLVLGSGLSLPEVAGVLEIPLGTVKSRLTAARTALTRILEEKGQNR
jgi:RNA polymerase sigma-70 factor (ECF subfamily)